jgi:uncharacterized membrane protein YfcA
METIPGLILIFLITTCGALLQGSMGFGLGLVSAPLLIFIDPVFVPGPVLLAAFFLNLFICFRERQAIHVQGFYWAVMGRTVGTVLGALILVLIPKTGLSVLFGVLVLAAVIISLAGFQLAATSENVFGVAIASGIMGTITSIGGPPMALVYQRHKGPTIRGTLSGVFLIGTLVSLVALAAVGRFGVEEIEAAALILPGVFLGFFLSNLYIEILDRGFIRPLVLIASAVSGIIVILRSFFH